MCSLGLFHTPKSLELHMASSRAVVRVQSYPVKADGESLKVGYLTLP